MEFLVAAILSQVGAPFLDVLRQKLFEGPASVAADKIRDLATGSLSVFGFAKYLKEDDVARQAVFTSVEAELPAIDTEQFLALPPDVGGDYLRALVKLIECLEKYAAAGAPAFQREAMFRGSVLGPDRVTYIVLPEDEWEDTSGVFIPEDRKLWWLPGFDQLPMRVSEPLSAETLEDVVVEADSRYRRGLSMKGAGGDIAGVRIASIRPTFVTVADDDERRPIVPAGVLRLLFDFLAQYDSDSRGAAGLKELLRA